MNLKNNRLINALMRRPVDRTPVWLMRQAGRYLPEYRKLRADVPDFMTFCRTPDLACEVTLQPLERFPLDAAIVFSDILTVPAAMGMDLQFVSGEGPRIHNPIRSLRDVEALKTPDVEDDLGYVMKALSLVSHELDGRVPLIGFAGSPWTVGAYMVEGRGGIGFPTMLKMAKEAPDVMHALLTRLADVTTHYLNAQIKAGAQAIMLFDTWGGLLSSSTYPTFSLQYMTRIAKGLIREVNGERIPLVFFTKGSGAWLEQIADAGCDAISLDSSINVKEARQRVGDRVGLQGNLDPSILLTDPDTVTQNVHRILRDYGSGAGHVFNLGHGIDKTTPIENVAALVEAVQSFQE